ncbi:hypothetical protein GQ42DRAFT_159999 [Ramicandelaber brevisporus]|nr:hypothetical protein GQ42DRAFT_159999 [Ramicandelaber brevisporus]
MKHFDADKLLEVIEQSNLETLQTIPTDDYSDEEVWKAISKTGLVRELLCCAIQMAVVGTGNKTYGTFVLDSKTHEVQDVFRKAGVHTDLIRFARVQPDILTPKRLMRFFRLHISKYIEKNAEIEPYLWRKYTKMSPAARHTTFPGAEFLITDRHQVDELLEAYKNLDAAQNTNFSVKAKRAFAARKVQVGDDEDLTAEPTQAEQGEGKQQQV